MALLTLVLTTLCLASTAATTVVELATLSTLTYSDGTTADWGGDAADGGVAHVNALPW